MKKLLIFAIMLCIGVLNVNATSDSYYVNINNVRFTQTQYEYFSKMYFEGYQDYMTQEEFDSIDINLMNPDLVETVYIFPSNLTRSTSISEQGRTLKISKTASTNYSYISTTLTWTNAPSVKSYDVIGARLSNTSLSNTPTTRLYNDSGYKSYNIDVSATNGFGSSVLLSGSNIRVTQSFQVKNGGTVYASYQHAKSTISLANSKKYTISANGYGKVFAFTGTATSVYDQMSGVSISV